jgi:hypothetical protein
METHLFSALRGGSISERVGKDFDFERVRRYFDHSEVSRLVPLTSSKVERNAWNHFSTPARRCSRQILRRNHFLENQRRRAFLGPEGVRFEMAIGHRTCLAARNLAIHSHEKRSSLDSTINLAR